MTDDFYSLLGVDADASVDDIKAAYRVRKDEIDTGSASGKADAAKLNKAWNTLSDPYQRGRYDAKREEMGDEIDVRDVDEVDAQSNGKGKARGAQPARAGRQPRQPRQPLVPTITPPDGTHFPPNKSRLIALGIDLLVLFVLFLAFSYAGHVIADSQHPGTFNRIDTLTKQVSDDAKATSDANKAASTAKTNNASNQAELQKTADDAKAKEKADQKALDDANAIVDGPQFLALGIMFLVGFLYLVIPATMTGRTFGLKMQHLKVVREDGSRLRAGDAIKRYGLLIIVTFALWFLLRLGPLAPALVLIGVTMWMRNANMQGMHDRIAHTIVVSDAAN